jgi:coproporphyrinogen III oxidase
MDTEKRYGLAFTERQEKIVIDLLAIQDSICIALSEQDGQSFQEDNWNHSSGGGGRTRIIKGNHIEKGGVNFSVVTGEIPPMMKGNMHAEAKTFFATGVSLVIHPVSPKVPIVHMNVRYFESDAGDAWIGGGIDLTPIYVDDMQAANFHNCLKGTCDKHNEEFYPKFKAWADDYFFLKHRNETRGIGGVFYDYLKPENTGFQSMEDLWEFNRDIGHTFNRAYIPILSESKDLSYTENEKRFQLLRRGRYVEFNLVWDKGTLFGLQTGGRTESILMSLPQFASWEYAPVFEENSPEQETLKKLRKGIVWA